MNPIASNEKSFAEQSFSLALRCAKAIDEIEPSDCAWDDEEIARMVQFSGMIGTDNLSYADD